MVITKIAGNLNDCSSLDKNIDWLELEWEELNKRIFRKQTVNGTDIAVSLENSGTLRFGDVLYEDENTLVAIRTKLEKALVIKPKTMREMGKVAFEIGNRHTPCIIEDNEILVRYDHTLEKLLDEVGVIYEQSERRFKEPFKYKGHQH
ncbi:urease accessory protein UreE [Bacillus sp. FJAT-27245]|uniref:urease accessory protein UreE n=1 Tax=Bacillus sp. FJAT-27245 TaxID=1684144 RepID=UPI0006A78F67|nr:urease accessory protein UreE [Bacillus sp. FJAT-27245]